MLYTFNLWGIVDHSKNEIGETCLNMIHIVYLASLSSACIKVGLHYVTFTFSYHCHKYVFVANLCWIPQKNGQGNINFISSGMNNTKRKDKYTFAHLLHIYLYLI